MEGRLSTSDRLQLASPTVTEAPHQALPASINPSIRVRRSKPARGDHRLSTWRGRIGSPSSALRGTITHISHKLIASNLRVYVPRMTVHHPYTRITPLSRRTRGRNPLANRGRPQTGGPSSKVSLLSRPTICRIASGLYSPSHSSTQCNPDASR